MLIAFYIRGTSLYFITGKFIIMNCKILHLLSLLFFILSSNIIIGQRYYSEPDIANIRADLDSFYTISRSMSDNLLSMQKLDEHYCVYKASNNFDLENYFNIIMDDRITVTDKRLRFLLNNHYCLSDSEMSKAKQFLLQNIGSFSYGLYAKFVSLYDLESIAPSIPPLSYEDIFNVIKNKGYLNREQKNMLSDYAILANIGRIDENEFIQFIIDVLNLRLEEDPIGVNLFFGQFFEYCLPMLESKNSIISTIDVFLDDKLVLLNNDYNSIHESSHSDQHNEAEHDHIHVGHSQDISISIAQQYINYCVVPKILLNGELIYLFFDVDNNIKEIKELILSDQVIWKSEVIKD